MGVKGEAPDAVVNEIERIGKKFASRVESF